MLQITNKKKFTLLCSVLILIISLGAYGLFRWASAPPALALKNITDTQQQELQTSVFNKNLELFKFENDEKQSGPITLTTFDEKESGSKESQFIFSEKYQDGYKFTQGKTEIKIIPQDINNQKFNRQVAKDVKFAKDKQQTEGEFVAYENNEGEKHLFALSRSDNTLKQWSLYEEYQPSINESWEFQGATLKQTEDGIIEVYKMPYNSESESTVKTLEPDMAQRIENTLKAEMGADYYFQKSNFLFTIPKPYFMGQNGERKDAQVNIENQNILKINLEASKEDFPLLLDPTIILLAKMNYLQINGDSASDQFGYSVSIAGDVNGDGKDDVIVGANQDDDGGSGSGSAFIFYGGAKTTGSATTRADVKLTGDAASDYFGRSVASAGDMNGDGLDDVIVGATGDDDGGSVSGSAFIFYGGVTSGGATAKADVKLTGDAADDNFGYSVDSAGDMNGDGLDDVIVGAHWDDDGGSASGSAFIFYGGVTSGVATTKANVKLTGDAAGDEFGTSVASAGDVNGDGRADVIVGAPYDDDGGSASGSAFIFYGGVTSGGATAQANVKLTGDAASDYFGRSVASAGDMNGDGLDDVIVGATGDDDGGSVSGSAFIFYGGVTSGVATTKANVKLTGDAAGDEFGTSVASAGDVNGDGKDDVIVGAYLDDDSGAMSGSAFIFYGGVTSGAATAKANVKITGDSGGDYFGNSVASAGDVNGDGKDDVIVAAYGDDDGGSGSGSAKIYTFNDLQNSVKLTGDAASDYFGYSVASAGDVNGDGKNDVIVGAYNDDDGGSASGSAFIFYGGVNSGGATAKANVKLTGDSASDQFGYSVSTAGDMNGDGLDDVIVGAQGDDDGGDASGSAFIFYGGVTSGSATAKANVKLIGDAAIDYFGYSVASAGDVNGDGKADVIVGALYDDDGGDASGSAFIFYGGITSGSATAKADVKLTGDAADDSFGNSVASAGDVNGDGLDDVIVGAPYDDDGGTWSGAAFIFYGGVASGGATAKANVKLTGDATNNFFGNSVSTAGDVNGDGKDDVIVGALFNANNGAAYIFYGGVTSGGATTKANVKLTGDSASDQFGNSVASAGDVNGDGLDDVIVGANKDDDGGSASGSVFIFYGGVTSGVATTKANVKLTGDAAGDEFGYSVASAGDVNGDGKDDIIAGAHYDDDSGDASGSAFIYTLGPSGEMLKYDGDSASDELGRSVASAGDVNGDGLDDVIVGAKEDDDGGDGSGSAFIFYGGGLDGVATAKADVKLTGDAASDYFGDSVASAGDVNGDGKADVIVGAFGDDDGGSASGSVFIFYGGVTSGSATAQANVKITGDTASDNFGRSVASAGDVNGDGKDDVIVGAHYDDDGGSASGSAFIFYGGVTSGGATAQATVKLTGDAADDYFGRSVASAGDVNGDGKDDVIVGAYSDDDGGSASGSAFIFHGGVTSGSATAQANVKITGDAASDYFGISVATAGDVNGDGKADVIVGAYQDDDGGSASGSAFIFYGGVTSGSATTQANVKLTGDSASDYFGLSVASAGDVNGDGKADVIVGAYGDDDGGSASGSAFIFYGGVTSGGATAKADVKLTGDAADDNFGYFVASAGDVNGDGKTDVIVGASGDDDGGSGSGSAKIFTDLATKDNPDSPNFQLNGDAADDNFGYSVASASDVNGDGKADVIVGAWVDDDNGSASGSAFIFYGGVNSGGATAKANVKLTGDSADDYFGKSVSSAGDVNGDGLDDVIVGASWDDDGGSASGSAFIFYGGVTSGAATAKANVKITGDAGGDQFGSFVSSAGDINGDGKDDVIVGAPLDDDNGSGSGSAFIFYGGVTSGGATAKANVKLIGDAGNNGFGRVASVGDVNGDGKDDVIVGASSVDSYAGAAYIFYGGVTSGGATAKANVKLTGDAASDYFGWSVASAGDVNGDGKDDVIVGAYADDDGGSDSGSAFIFYGGVTSGGATAKANVKLTGDSASDNFGTSVSSAGDVNSDGLDDVIVGAPFDDDGGSASGSAFIFYGGVTSGAATAKADVKLTGDAASDYFGYSVASASDVNGDGKADVIVGANEDDDGGSNSGSARIIYGHRISPEMPTTLTPTSGTYTFGQDVSISCSGGTYNTAQDKYGQTMLWDIESFFAGAWHEVVSGDADGSYTYSVNPIPNEGAVKLRCRNEISGALGGFSRWWEPLQAGLSVVQGGLKLEGGLKFQGGVKME